MRKCKGEEEGGGGRGQVVVVWGGGQHLFKYLDRQDHNQHTPIEKPVPFNKD